MRSPPQRLRRPRTDFTASRRGALDPAQEIAIRPASRPGEHKGFAPRLAALLAMLAALSGAAMGAQRMTERPPAAALPPAVQAALTSAGVPASAVAAWLQPVDAAQPVLAVNAARPMNPASTIKLVTTYAALELLGPAFVWKTEAWIAGALSGGVLEGDLVLKGGGDPRLTIEQLWRLARGLRDRGLAEIRGDLVFDRGLFEPAEHDPSRFDGEATRPYNVGPDALLVNFKAFRFAFTPDPDSRSARVSVEPRSALLELGAQVRLSDEPCGDWRRSLRASFQPPAAGAAGPRVTRASFTGSYPASCGERIWNVALQSHTDYLHGVFRALWEEMGGTLRGGAREGAVPAGARLIHVLESAPLTEAVRDINKFSNNVMARQLYLTLAAQLEGAPARAERSAALIRQWLEGKGLTMPELVLENGSGLSRRESVSAANLGRLLIAAFRGPTMPEFVSSMPLVAQDGTLRRRMRTDPVAGQAHLKTGSLSDVRSVAGYVLDRSGRRQALVFFVNHPNAGATQAALDAFVRWAHER